MQSLLRLGFVVISTVVLAGLVVSPGDATGGDDSYTVKILKNPNGYPYMYANDINDSGRIVGGQEYYVDGWGWVQDAIIWEKWDKDPTVLTPLAGHTDGVAMAMNNTGQVCGRSTDWMTEMKAVIWDKDGTAVDMHPADLGGYYSQMFCINQYGDAAGIFYGPFYGRAFRTYAGEEPEALEFDTDAYVHCWPHAMNKDGVVVGFAREDDGSGWGYIHACYWDEDGNFYDMHPDIEEDLGTDVLASRAWTISDDGEIGGVAVLELGVHIMAFIWTPDGGFDWVDCDGADQSAVGGTAGKYFVGIVDGALQGWDWAAATVTIWTRTVESGEVVWDLDYIPRPEGHSGAATWGCNTSGRVVGVSSDDAGYWYAWYAEK